MGYFAKFIIIFIVLAITVAFLVRTFNDTGQFAFLWATIGLSYTLGSMEGNTDNKNNNHFTH